MDNPGSPSGAQQDDHWAAIAELDEFDDCSPFGTRFDIEEPREIKSYVTPEKLARKKEELKKRSRERRAARRREKDGERMREESAARREEEREWTRQRRVMQKDQERFRRIAMMVEEEAERNTESRALRREDMNVEGAGKETEEGPRNPQVVEEEEEDANSLASLQEQLRDIRLQPEPRRGGRRGVRERMREAQRRTVRWGDGGNREEEKEEAEEEEEREGPGNPWVLAESGERTASLQERLKVMSLPQLQEVKEWQGP